MLKRVEGIALQPRKLPDTGSVVLLPPEFLKNRKLAPAMLAGRDERAFDVFLLLWRRFAESGYDRRRSLSLRVDEAAESLGIQHVRKPSSRRFRIEQALEKLRDRYGLIEYSAPDRESFKSRLARGGLSRPRKGTGIPLPSAYWDYGWCRTLSMRAKVVYLICLAEQQSSSTAPYWSLSQENLAKKYTNARTHWTVNKGVRELEMLDILHVGRDNSELGEPFSRRAPNMYRLNPLLSPEEIQNAWKEMDEKHGAEKVKQARRLAEMLDRPNSRETAGGFIWCIDNHGLEATEAKTRDVAKLSPVNPYRHVGTVIHRLKQKARGVRDSAE
jgi:hypothetical protein